MFRFKQFTVDQTGCAMKINTDGVLLGAIATASKAQKILDIGTGTGVIALMLAQKYNDASINAVEIDIAAAETAERNFKSSKFHEQLQIHPVGIGEFFDKHPNEKFDLIVSNPPFYINSLESPETKKTVAKHTDVDFFKDLLKDAVQHLAPNGVFWLILPIATAQEVKFLASRNGLYLQNNILIKSFESSNPHREIICFGFDDLPMLAESLVIYESAGVYTDQYKMTLAPYFLNF